MVEGEGPVGVGVFGRGGSGILFLCLSPSLGSMWRHLIKFEIGYVLDFLGKSWTALWTVRERRARLWRFGFINRLSDDGFEAVSIWALMYVRWNLRSTNPSKRPRR